MNKNTTRIIDAECSLQKVLEEAKIFFAISIFLQI